MTVRPAPWLALLVVLTLAAACSGDASGGSEASRASTGSPPEKPSGAPVNDLVGSYRTPSLPIARLARLAKHEGFDPADVAAYLDESYPDARTVVYTLEVSETTWVVFDSADGGPARDIWAGPYRLVGDATVVAGTPPCGPITIDYELSGDTLELEMTDSDCLEGGVVPQGELIAGATIYKTAPYRRIG
jgi:hypothetical protein